MATVVCDKNCPYRMATFCRKEFIMLNQFGMCNEWFDRNGQMRVAPFYQPESKPMDATEQKPPQQEKSEELATDLGASEESVAS